MKLKKLLRLNNLGFGHFEAVVAIAVIAMVGVVGIYISKHNDGHAEPLNQSSTLSCNIDDVTKPITVGQTVGANIIIHNSNNVAVKSKFQAEIGETNAQGQSKGSGHRSFVEVPADGSSTQNIYGLVIESGYIKVVVKGQGFNSPYQFNCTKTVDVS